MVTQDVVNILNSMRSLSSLLNIYTNLIMGDQLRYALGGEALEPLRKLTSILKEGDKLKAQMENLKMEKTWERVMDQLPIYFSTIGLRGLIYF